MINLMPPDLKESVKFGSHNVSVLQYMILIVISGIALAAVIAFGVQIVRNDESKLRTSIDAKQSQLVQYEADIEKAKRLSEKIDTVDILLDKELRFSILLQEIGGLMPPGSSLTRLELTNDLSENLLLVARVDSEETATELQLNLANSSLFSGADIQQLAGGNVTIIVSYDLKGAEQQL